MTDNKNSAIQNILSRRSIRRFDPGRKVPDETVKLLLECACAAPTARNYRPWQFIVVEDREKMLAVRDLHPFASMLSEASLLIVVCGYTVKGDLKIPYWEHDCAAAMQNILLAANASGLGSVWLGVRHTVGGIENDVKSLFEIPEGVAVLGMAAIGYPLVTEDPHKGIDPCVIHVNKW